MNNLLFNTRGRLRAGWSLVLFLAIAYVTAYALYSITAVFAVSPQWISVRFFVRPLIFPIALLVAHVAMLAIDHRGWNFVALGRNALAPSSLAFGLAFGALAIAVPTAVLLFAKQFTLIPAPDGSWIAATLRTSAVLIPAALWEELMFRGYPFAVLRESFGWKSALIATSFVFGAAHIQNSGASLENILIVIAAGFFLGMILLATKSLYATWAAHFAWNWVMACGFHVSVSGNPFERPDYALVPVGPSWLTGGGWGPEGGIGAAVGLFAALFYVYGRYLKRLES